MEISIKNDSLNVLQSWNKSTYKIVNTTGNAYEITNDPSIQFVFSELKKDETQILTVFQEGNETTFKRKESIDLSKLDTEDYTGQFYSKELDATYLLFKEGETLKIKIANYEAQELDIYGKDIFTTDGDLVRFHRSNGKIEGFELDAGRVTNLKFEKK